MNTSNSNLDYSFNSYLNSSNSNIEYKLTNTTTIDYNKLNNKPWVKSENNDNIYYNFLGNVGIGSSIPTEKLDLGDGNIKTAGKGIFGNLQITGDTTILNTTLYQTEQLEVRNDTIATAMVIKQVNTSKNVVEFYNNETNLALVINNIGNVGIGSSMPITNLDMGLGSIKTTDLYNTDNLIISTTGNNNHIAFKNNGVEKIKINNNGIIFNDGTITRKALKYFTTARIASFNNINCLTYDIDLNSICKKITLDSYEHRHFRIKLFNSNGKMDKLFAPKFYNISMSSYNGLSIHAIDYDFNVTYLDKVYNTYGLFKNNINTLTFIAPTVNYGTSHMKIYYIIEDLLGQ